MTCEYQSKLNILFFNEVFVFQNFMNTYNQYNENGFTIVKKLFSKKPY